MEVDVKQYKIDQDLLNIVKETLARGIHPSLPFANVNEILLSLEKLERTN